MQKSNMTSINSAEDLSASFRSHMKAFRDKHGLSQKVVCTQLHWSQSKYSKIENGTCIPSLPDIFEFLKYSNTSFSDIAVFKNKLEDEAILQTPDLSTSSPNQEVHESVDSLFPMTKCSNTTYYIYFLRGAIDNENNVVWSIQDATIQIDKPTTSLSASATLYYGKDKIDGKIEMDMTFAYVSFFDRMRDFHFEIVFNYYRSSVMRSKREAAVYIGGLGLLLTADSDHLRQAQYVILSYNALSKAKREDAKNYLWLQANRSDSIHNKFSKGLIKLLPRRDAQVFDWLKAGTSRACSHKSNNVVE